MVDETVLQNYLKRMDCGYPLDAYARTGGGLNMRKPTDKQYNEYQKMLRDRDSDRLLTPDGLRLICSSNEYDPVKIGLHFLTVLANWNKVDV